MSFAHTVVRAWDRSTLLSVLLELTYRCNWDCVFCYNDLARPGTPLGLPQYLGLLDELAEMQVLNLILSGGEPLTSPHFFAIGRRSRELGFVTRIKSNGHALRPAVAERIKREIAPFVVELSLHGACAETHDRQTRVAGSFDRLFENLAGMRDVGLRAKFNVPLTRWNEAELEAMFALADQWNVPIQVDPDIKPRDDGDREPLTLAPSEHAIARLHALEAARPAHTKAVMGSNTSYQAPPPEERPSEPTRHCGAGAATAAIDPYGNVLPCVQWREPMGNLHEQGFRQVWEGSDGLQKVRRTTRALVSELSAGQRRAGFCPGAARLHGGTPATPYPGAQRRVRVMTRRHLPVVGW